MPLRYDVRVFNCLMRMEFYTIVQSLSAVGSSPAAIEGAIYHEPVMMSAKA